MRVLLLLPDCARRQALREACAQLQAEVACADPADASTAVFGSAPDRMALLVIEQLLLQRQGLALLASWRRMAPRSQLLLLDEDESRDGERIRQALHDAHGCD